MQQTKTEALTLLEQANKSMSQKDSLFFVLRGCIIAGILVYMFFSPLVLRPLYYAFLFHSNPYSSTLFDLSPYEREFGCRPCDVFFDTPGAKLHGWYFKNPNSKNTVLLCHAQGGNISMFGYEAAVLSKEGVSVLIFDYKGMGRSSGVPSLAGLNEDTLAAYKYLVDKEKVPANRIIIYGISLGTAPAAALAAEKPCKGLILFAPYVSLRAASKRLFPHLHAYPECLFPEHDIGSLTSASQFKAATLIVHGDHDSIIPFNEGRKIFNAIPCKKRFLCLKGIGHGNFQGFPKMEQMLHSEMQEFIADLDNPNKLTFRSSRTLSPSELTSLDQLSGSSNFAFSAFDEPVPD